MDGKDLVSYLGMCVSFILIFNIFIKYYKYFNTSMALWIENLGTRVNKFSEGYSNTCLELIDKAEDNNHDKLLMRTKEKIDNYSQTHVQYLNDYILDTKNQKHLLMSFFSIIIAVLTTQTILLPTIYDFDIKSSYDSIWEITILISFILYIITTVTHLNKLKIQVDEPAPSIIAKYRHVLYIMLTVILFVLASYICYYGKQLFFIYIFAYYYLALLISKRVYPALDKKFIVIPKIKNLYDGTCNSINHFDETLKK